MVVVKPFPALLPKPALAARVSAPPYDVMSTAEARSMAADNPLSFLHVSRSEIDLPPDTGPYTPEVYAKARENFDGLRSEGALVPDAQACFYLYRQTLGAQRQTGIVGAVSCQDYLAGRVRKHELTRVEKENDRVRHMEALDAQTGPALLIHRSAPEIESFVAERCALPAMVDFIAPDEVQQTAWRVDDPEGISLLESEFARMGRLYIADGHHRTAAAGRVFETRRGQGGSGLFLAVIFPQTQLRILPYHRVLKDLNGRSSRQLLEEISRVFEVFETGESAPRRRNEMSLYLEGRWRGVRFHAAPAKSADLARALDVARLQTEVLGPLFGIDDPRTSDRIGFVGGIRGTEELARLVDVGDYACAFSMFPTAIDDLLAIADAGELMPPKSTWFEPKLRDAMFCHLI